MKELGERLKELRKKSGVTIEEASNDLDISAIELECIENGNFKAFKDVYELKKMVSNYSRYLGINENSISDEFNDFLFEKTSKISLDDIKSSLKNNDDVNNERVSSPYTKFKPTKYDYAPIVLVIVFLVFISLIIYLGLLFIKGDDNVDRELKGIYREERYEFTK